MRRVEAAETAPRPKASTKKPSWRWFGVEIRLAGTQQPYIGRDDFSNAQPGALGQCLVQCFAHPGKLRQRRADQGKSGMVGEQFGALLELEAGKGLPLGWCTL